MLDHVTDLIEPDSVDQRYIVPGLQKGLRLLQSFTREQPAMSLADIARAIGLTRSAAFRLVYTLETLGFLERDRDERRYRLGPHIMSLGFAYLASNDLVELSRPVLEELRDSSGMATQLAILDATDIVYLARCDSNSSLTSTVAVGARLPAHATATGRILLMEHSQAALQSRFAGAQFAGFTAATPRSLAQLAALLAEDRRRGHVLSHSNFEPGVDMLALPVRDDRGAIRAAISLVGHAWPTDDPAWTDHLIAVGQAAADRISLRLGHRPAASKDAA